ncbi:MAG: hypothetical protein D6781_00700 [Verrucomicrobia bacterium]|nr:MAG: hypothetical protein D6781_00700 [Verrucomicrobiota bacterium]
MRWPVTKAFLESRSFGEFVRNKHFREDQAGFTQFESLADEDNREIIVDFVAHQETLENDFAILCKRVGCPHLKLEWRNVSHRRSPWQSFYASSADRDFVYDLYKVDFETFGYSRELDREPDRAAMTAGRGRADLAS